MTLHMRVPDDQDGWLLRDVLRRGGFSASVLTELKRSDGIRVDGKFLRVNERVRVGAEIELTLPAESDTSVVPQDLPLSIVHESAHFVVLNKQAGMTVHPTLGYPDGTLANAWMGELKKRGEKGIFRPVNRLDRNTSGLVLCAKNCWAASQLAQSVGKTYWAIVEGELPPCEGSIAAPIARCADSIVRRCVCAGGRESRTDYRIVASGGGHSLAACVPVTGRTHQIRVHFASIGHPLAGDDLYGGKIGAMTRHALHCGELRFREPESGESVCVSAPLPEDMFDFALRCNNLHKDFLQFKILR